MSKSLSKGAIEFSPGVFNNPSDPQTRRNPIKWSINEKSTELAYLIHMGNIYCLILAISLQPWRFCGPLVWALSFSTDPGQVIGWALPAALASFSQTNFLWLFVWDHCLASSFHLHHLGSRFLSRMCWYIFPFILHSITWRMPVVCREQTAWHYDVPSTKFQFGCGVPGAICSTLSLQTWCGIQRVQSWSHLTRPYPPSMSQANFIKL